jgi:hypothetical protein
MEWLVFFSFVFGALGGVCVGWSCGYDACYRGVFLRLRKWVCERLRVLESHIQEEKRSCDVDSGKSRLLDMGCHDGYSALLEYMDKEFLMEE